MAQHPAGNDPSSPLLLFEKIHGEIDIAFAHSRTLGIRDEHSFRGQVSTAHTLAHLRFAGLVTEGRRKGQAQARTTSFLNPEFVALVSEILGEEAEGVAGPT